MRAQYSTLRPQYSRTRRQIWCMTRQLRAQAAELRCSRRAGRAQLSHTSRLALAKWVAADRGNKAMSSPRLLVGRVVGR